MNRATLKKWLRTTSQPNRALMALSALLIVGISALFLIGLKSRYDAAVADAKRSAQDFAVVLAEHTARAFEAVEQTLRVAEDIRREIDAGRQLGPDATRQALRNLKRSSPLIVAIGWTNAAGELLANSYEGDPPRRNISDLSHFIEQRERSGNDISIAPPFRSDATGAWITAVALRAVNPDGSFAGVVTAPLDQSYFASIFRSIRPGPNGAVALLHRDGQVLMREPSVAGGIGRSFADSTLFREYLPRTDEGVFETTSRIDGIARFFAYRVVPGFPLVLVVAHDRLDALQSWYDHLGTVGPLVAALLILIVLGTYLLLRGTQELKDSEARYRLLADNSTDMVFTLDLEFVRSYVSPASLEILGYRPEELIGTKPLDMIHPDDADRVRLIYTSVFNGLERFDVTNRIRHRDGRWIWVEAALRLMRHPDTGRPAGILGALRDVSTRKAIEADFVAAGRQAGRAAAAQAQFLATMSHELRTPLNSVLGFADIILERHDIGPEIRREVGLIHTAGTFLLTVVNDILDFSKIEEGKLELAPAAFSVTALIDNSISIIRDSATRKELDLGVTTDPQLPAGLLGDESRLRQILLNLLNNAIKFTHAGRVELNVKYLGTDGTCERIRFSVSDTGIGIPADKRDRLFHRFSQVDGSTGREFGGTGLGLAISKRLVELMGGEIGVESTSGEGSTFWFEVGLPAAEAPKPVQPRHDGPPTQARRILLVEDIEVNQEIACAMLAGAGHQVDVVSEGAAAIAAVTTNHYDIVLMDIQMAGIDGVTATRRIRSLPGPAAQVPIIAMTANVLPQQVQSFRDAGMNGHVGKPLRRETLLAAIDRCTPAEAAVTTTVAAPEPAVMDEQIFAETLALFGDDRTRQLMGQLAAQLARQFVKNPETAEERTQLAREAHKLISTSGIFGLTALSTSCLELEAAIQRNAYSDELLDKVRIASREAAIKIAKRLAEVAPTNPNGSHLSAVRSVG